jgi:FtsZ-binding cell division protein ZapB
MKSIEDLERRVLALKESIVTVSLQIEELKHFYNSLQVRAWRKHKAKLNRKLKEAKHLLKETQNT